MEATVTTSAYFWAAIALYAIATVALVVLTVKTGIEARRLERYWENH
jgi:hypothetical protein